MDVCETCQKTKDLCLCDQLSRFDNRVKVLILQHPQEPDKELGSARLATLILANSQLRTGFSVPNLAKALGGPADSAEWVVLYLGSKYKFQRTLEQAESSGHSELAFFNKKDEPVNFPLAKVKGVVVIDGTWAQAKALWWRNPWLLKLTRVAVLPRSRSRYGNLRREPRKECVSTIEAIAYTLEALGEDPAIPDALVGAFGKLVERYRQRRSQGGTAAAKTPSADNTARSGAPTRAQKAAVSNGNGPKPGDGPIAK